MYNLTCSTIELNLTNEYSSLPLSQSMDKKPIINCHTHIFTGDHVPPYLAKTFVPAPFYRLLNMNWVVAFFRRWNKLKSRITYSPQAKKFEIFKNKARILINKLGFVKTIISWAVTFEVLLILYRFFKTIKEGEDGTILKVLTKVMDWCDVHGLLIPEGSLTAQIILTLFLFIFIPSGRNFILFIFKKLYSFLGAFPGKQSKELAKRYLNIGRYAFHEKQTTIFSKLKGQYPPGSKFVLLPMDMTYMDAGDLKVNYHEQMKELAALKNRNPEIFYPFVFADPRRMKEDISYFKWSALNGTVTLENCFMKEFLEGHKFNGIKIYPALGYYPFDERLLPLWKYAADHQIPITTHCIRGTIYYRGSKQVSWNRHEVFEQANGNGEYVPLLLPQMNALENSYNFTHPLNYLCLLNEGLLRKLVATSSAAVQDLFGFTNIETPLKYNLEHLKICFAHFGGDDEWLKFFERDRDNYAGQSLKNPEKGIDFFNDVKGNPARGKLEIIWKSVDWYTIITSLMLQYKNVYADISYILHDETALLPLLKQTLLNEKLQKRVLFGTDFFVVRNHKSDKQMLADMMCGLTEEEFDIIARENPVEFLHTI